MILQKVNFFLFFSTSFRVQAVLLEEKVRKGAMLILKINGGLLSQ